jgi:hypothetical protein
VDPTWEAEGILPARSSHGGSSLTECHDTSQSPDDQLCFDRLSFVSCRRERSMLTATP